MTDQNPLHEFVRALARRQARLDAAEEAESLAKRNAGAESGELRPDDKATDCDSID